MFPFHLLLSFTQCFFYIQVQIPGLEELQVFVPFGLIDQRAVILQLLNAAAGKDCSKEPDELPDDEAYLLMSKHGAGDTATDSDWAQWDGELLTLIPQMETVDTLRAMKVRDVFKFVFCGCACLAFKGLPLDQFVFRWRICF